MLALGLVLLATIVIGAVALSNLSDEPRQVVTQDRPGRVPRLAALCRHAQSGDRRPRLSAQRSAIIPRARTPWGGRPGGQVAALRPLLAGLPGAQHDLATALRPDHGMADQLRRAGHPRGGGNRQAAARRQHRRGKALFDSVRAPLAAFQRDLAAQRTLAVDQLNSSAVGPGLRRHRQRGRACCWWSSRSASACGPLRSRR